MFVVVVMTFGVVNRASINSINSVDSVQSWQLFQSFLSYLIQHRIVISLGVHQLRCKLVSDVPKLNHSGSKNTFDDGVPILSSTTNERTFATASKLVQDVREWTRNLFGCHYGLCCFGLIDWYGRLKK